MKTNYQDISCYLFWGFSGITETTVSTGSTKNVKTFSDVLHLTVKWMRSVLLSEWDHDHWAVPSTGKWFAEAGISIIGTCHFLRYSGQYLICPCRTLQDEQIVSQCSCSSPQEFSGKFFFIWMWGLMIEDVVCCTKHQNLFKTTFCNGEPTPKARPGNRTTDRSSVDLSWSRQEWKPKSQ